MTNHFQKSIPQTTHATLASFPFRFCFRFQVQHFATAQKLFQLVAPPLYYADKLAPNNESGSRGFRGVGPLPQRSVTKLL